MDDLFLSTRLPDGRQLCVSPLSRETFEANHLESLGDDLGYFIYEFEPAQPNAGIEILAKTASYYAALRLVDIFIAAHGRDSSESPIETM